MKSATSMGFMKIVALMDEW